MADWHLQGFLANATVLSKCIHAVNMDMCCVSWQLAYDACCVTNYLTSVLQSNTGIARLLLILITPAPLCKECGFQRPM